MIILDALLIIIGCIALIFSGHIDPFIVLGIGLIALALKPERP
jgi:hypothetical protein